MEYAHCRLVCMLKSQAACVGQHKLSIELDNALALVVPS